jgi:hypothetical protein
MTDSDGSGQNDNLVLTVVGDPTMTTSRSQSVESVESADEQAATDESGAESSNAIVTVLGSPSMIDSGGSGQNSNLVLTVVGQPTMTTTGSQTVEQAGTDDSGAQSGNAIVTVLGSPSMIDSDGSGQNNNLVITAVGQPTMTTTDSQSIESVESAESDTEPPITGESIEGPTVEQAEVTTQTTETPVS